MKNENGMVFAQKLVYEIIVAFLLLLLFQNAFQESKQKKKEKKEWKNPKMKRIEPIYVRACIK